MQTYEVAGKESKKKSPYTIDAVSGFLNRLSLKLDHVIIGNTKARKSAGVDALPTTLLISKNGRVRFC